MTARRLCIALAIVAFNIFLVGTGYLLISQSNNQRKADENRLNQLHRQLDKNNTALGVAEAADAALAQQLAQLGVRPIVPVIVPPTVEVPPPVTTTTRPTVVPTTTPATLPTTTTPVPPPGTTCVSLPLVKVCV